MTKTLDEAPSRGARWTAAVLGAVGALPLVAYPAVLVANVMSVAGHRTGEESAALTAVVWAFALSSLAYPLVYLACGVVAWRAWRRGPASRLVGAGAAPLVYLALVVGLFALWTVLE